MKFSAWYKKHRPVLAALSLLWFLPGKFTKPLQQLLETLDYAVAVGGVWIENVTVRE